MLPASVLPSDRSLPSEEPRDPLVVPSPAPPPRRTPVPWFASLAPVGGAIGMWLITGSPYALWFAALGPVIAIGAALDGRRVARRDRRAADAHRAAARRRIEAEIEHRHDAERAALRARHPDLLGYLAAPHEIWRSVPGRADTVVVGRGAVASTVRVQGEDDDLGRRLRATAARLTDAPVVVPAAAGVAVVGPEVPAVAVARALLVQLSCTTPPGRMQVAGAGAPEWASALPHVVPAVAVCHLDARSAAGRAPTDPAVVVVPPGAVPPPQCAAVLTLTGADSARLDHAGGSTDVRIEALGSAQARRIAAALADRAAAVGGHVRIPAEVAAAALGPDPGGPGLGVAVGHDGSAPVRVDLVADGPHALVTGMTGAGKSELLITWVAGLSASRSTREVVFLLADFKGGTAFDALSALPHVTGVLTDLDGAGAERALQSLRAEIRHRERVIAAVGARDIDHPDVELPRLVIVVDELAALLDGHRELGAVFADVAARGRALGMHLVLGTQRATGVVRDSLMANCPLRISLRVVDPVDSRHVLGSDAAAALPGDAAARGLAFVRRAADDAPVLVRVARTTAADIAAIVRARASDPAPRAPWQPPLPARVSLDALARDADGTDPVIGLADEPDRQRHRPVRLPDGDPGLLVVGGPGSGKTTALAAIAAQTDPVRVRWLPADPEPLWDGLCELLEDAPVPGTLLIIDDLDVALAGFPPDYGAGAAAMLEQLCRTARGLGIRVAVSTARVSGPLARIADLLARRVVLRMPSRLEHAAAGADPSAYDPDAPAGRAHLDGRLVQIADARRPPEREGPAAVSWTPSSPVAGVVLRAGGSARRLRTALQERGIRVRDVAEDPEGLIRLGEGNERTVIIGEPEQWQRSWRVLQAVRERGDLVVDASCLLEYRVLTGDRMPPPYCVPGRGRAWLLRDGEPPLRVTLPGAEQSLRRRVA